MIIGKINRESEGTYMLFMLGWTIGAISGVIIMALFVAARDYDKLYKDYDEND